MRSLMNTLKFEVSHSLTKLTQEEWDELEHTFPFSRYAFLKALEVGQCLTSETGWSPYILTCQCDGILQGALYGQLKSHSYGEYIFDWAIADAYHRNKQAYYPKYVSAIPFTPATGAKFLFHREASKTKREEMTQLFLSHLKGLTQLSSLHFLFSDLKESFLENIPLLLKRQSFQYHWKNNALSFDDFLTKLKSRKAKMIKKERAQVASYNLKIERYWGTKAAPFTDIVFELYLTTIQKKGAIPYLTRGFFAALFKEQDSSHFVDLAFHQGQPIAFSLFFYSSTTLYGRYWGIAPEYLNDYPLLHFEMCYYRGMEVCFEKKLGLFEAGAQGEHKIPRGFAPKITHSSHYFFDDFWRSPILDFFKKEQAMNHEIIQELRKKLPFKKEISD